MAPGSTVTCNGTQTTRVGQGPGTDNVTVTVNDGGTIAVSNANSISLGNNATITLGTSGPTPGGSAFNPAVTVQTTTNASASGGQYGDGSNTIDVGSNSLITINKNASVIATGTQQISEAINTYGSGNTILNYGLIQGGPSSAIFFQNVNTTAASPPNVVDNFGTIQIIPVGSVNPITGNQAVSSYNNVGIDFINETGAKVIGNLVFQGGNDNVTLNPSSSVSGSFDGGGGNNLLTLNASGTSTDTLAGQVNNFQTLNKTGAGTWTLTGAIGDNTAAGSSPLAVSVVGGILELTGDNTAFNGTIFINPGISPTLAGPDPTATLEARAQSLPPLITDHGILLVNQLSPDGIQPADGTYAGVIQGTGVVTKIGAGTVTLSGLNTYTGGTNLNVGAIAAAADTALGNANGGLTFSGGTLRLLGRFDLAATRAIVLNGPSAGLAGGGTIDTNGFQTTLVQAVSGAGALTKAGSGVLTLTAASSYAGGTSISAGTLQLGNGGTTGGIVGNVADNGALAFDRADAVTFAGLVSGTGALVQAGSGTTALTAANTYMGGTTISFGTLQLGNGGTTGSIVGNVMDNGALAFDRADAVTFAGLVSGSGALVQAGTGTTTLTASNTYTGGTTIRAGTLQLGNGETAGSIVGNVTDNGTLAFDRADTITFPGAISGFGGVAQIGSGATILNAISPYAGPTLVSAGTLAVGDSAHDSASLSGGGAVSVASGAALGGYGTVAGDVTVNGSLAAANALPIFAGSPVGTFTTGGALLNHGAVDLAGSSIGNTLVVGGNYTGAGGTLTLSTFLNAGGPLSNQTTDRLLIDGNASGTTVVHVNVSGNGAYTGTGIPLASDGISLIQVGGTASSNTFTLAGGYVTNGTPYQYRLYAYGPGSTNGLAAASQSLVGNPSNHWDYRLQDSLVAPTGPVSPPAPPPASASPPATPVTPPMSPPAAQLPPDGRIVVAPQVPAYITMPTALFNAGFLDLDSLHRRLGEIRDSQQVEGGQESEVFVRGLGGRYQYTSDRSFGDYGYNSSQDYAATQFGANRIAIDNASGSLRVGLAGTIGRLSFQPSAVDGVSSGRFDTQSLAGTATWQSRAGWYIDAIVSGGRFDGNIQTAARGQTTDMNGSSFAASIEAGYPIALGWQGLALEPQAQFVYQHLDFARRTDVDGIDVNPGSLDQGVLRAGGRLKKQFVTADGTLFTPYLKANVLQGIGGGDSVQLGGVAFGTGRFGTSFQVGAGITGTLTRNLSIYSDVAWQDNAGGGGSRGWAFNGGFRFAF